MNNRLLTTPNNFLGLRISTNDRLKAEELQTKLGGKNSRELVRRLISDAAKELGVN